TELAGSSRSAIEATRLIDELSPNAVTVDARLPDGDGIDLAQRLHARYPELGLVVFGPPRDSLLVRAVTAGVSAYVTDAGETARVAAAIRSSLAGQCSFSSGSLAGALRNEHRSTLSRREREV